ASDDARWAPGHRPPRLRAQCLRQFRPLDARSHPGTGIGPPAGRTDDRRQTQPVGRAAGEGLTEPLLTGHPAVPRLGRPASRPDGPRPTPAGPMRADRPLRPHHPAPPTDSQTDSQRQPTPKGRQMTTQQFSGVLAAVVAPFTADGSAVDVEGVRRQVDHIISGGVNGLVPGGSTGEFTALTVEERKASNRAYIEAAAGRVPVVAGTGALSTAETIELTRDAKDAGADAVMV